MSKTMTAKQIADEFHVHERTINAWSSKLKALGIKTFFKSGRKPLKIT